MRPSCDLTFTDRVLMIICKQLIYYGLCAVRSPYFVAQLAKRICLQCGRPGFNPWVGKIPWRRERLLTPVFWPGEFHGLYSPWGHKELDRTERLWLCWSQLKLLSLTHCSPACGLVPNSPRTCIGPWPGVLGTLVPGDREIINCSPVYLCFLVLKMFLLPIAKVFALPLHTAMKSVCTVPHSYSSNFT